MTYVFWACLLLVVYTYVLYPILLFVAYALSQVRRDLQYLTARGDRRRRPLAPEELPLVSLVIPSFNEEHRLPDKLANLREIDFPREKLQVVFVSDGSTDRTNEILRALSESYVEVVILPVRQGKATALNHAVARARHDILVFSDAATLFAPDALKKLVRHFVDRRVGVVCGSLQFLRTAESAQTEGVYWKYETILRLMEARVGATLTASGAIYATRRACFRPLEPDVVIDDLVIPMNARKLGYEVVYDPEARGTEFAATSVSGEFARRVRLAVGSFRALGELIRVPFHPFACLAFLSHKVFRWILPFLLIGLLVSAGVLSDHPLYRVALVGQLLFYVWAGAGWLLRSRMERVRYALVGYYVCAIHLAFLIGWVKFLAGRQEVMWRRVS